FFFFQAEDGIRDKLVTEFRRVLFRSFVIADPLDANLRIALALKARKLFSPLNEDDAPLIHQVVDAKGLQLTRRVHAVEIDVEQEIGRASCRERVEIEVGAGA